MTRTALSTSYEPKELCPPLTGGHNFKYLLAIVVDEEMNAVKHRISHGVAFDEQFMLSTGKSDEFTVWSRFANAVLTSRVNNLVIAGLK